MEITREMRLNRMGLLLTDEQMERIGKAHVLLLGLGGVGSYAAEALARAGVGEMTIVDSDEVAVSNLNRQLPALVSTIGQRKVDVVARRIREIAPDIVLHAVNAFYLPESPVPVPENCAMVVDAIDTTSAKLHLAEVCLARGVPLVSCMGMGNRLDPTKIVIGDIYETSGCPLCRVMRSQLRKRGVPSLRCVYSTEAAIEPRVKEGAETKGAGRVAPGSVSFVPSVAGLYLAYEAIRQIAGF